MVAGEFSAANTGIVDALEPIPIPSSRRHANNWGHVCVKAEPMTETKQKMADTNIVPRRPMRWFNGWDSQQPLFGRVLASTIKIGRDIVQKGWREIWRCVHESKYPNVIAARFGIKAKSLRPIEICSSRPCLIPSPVTLPYQPSKIRRSKV